MAPAVWAPCPCCRALGEWLVPRPFFSAVARHPREGGLNWARPKAFLRPWRAWQHVQEGLEFVVTEGFFQGWPKSLFRGAVAQERLCLFQKAGV